MSSEEPCSPPSSPPHLPEPPGPRESYRETSDAGPVARRRPSVFGVLMVQAFWLSFAYLVVGLFIETMRRVTESEFWNRASQLADALALTALRKLGLVEWLVDAMAAGKLGAFAARIVLSGTTLCVIFAQAAILSAFFAAAVRLGRRG